MYAEREEKVYIIEPFSGVVGVVSDVFDAGKSRVFMARAFIIADDAIVWFDLYAAGEAVLAGITVSKGCWHRYIVTVKPFVYREGEYSGTACLLIDVKSDEGECPKSAMTVKKTYYMQLYAHTEAFVLTLPDFCILSHGESLIEVKEYLAFRLKSDMELLSVMGMDFPEPSDPGEWKTDEHTKIVSIEIPVPKYKEMNLKQYLL